MKRELVALEIQIASDDLRGKWISDSTGKIDIGFDLFGSRSATSPQLEAKIISIIVLHALHLARNML